MVYGFQDDANVTMSIYFDVPTKPFAKNNVKPSTSHADIGALLANFIGKGPVESGTVTVVKAVA